MHELASDLGQAVKLTIVIHLVLGVAWIGESDGEKRAAVQWAEDYRTQVKLNGQLGKLCLIKSVYRAFSLSEIELLYF